MKFAHGVAAQHNLSPPTPHFGAKNPLEKFSRTTFGRGIDKLFLPWYTNFTVIRGRGIFMKKIITFLIAVTLLFAMAACNTLPNDPSGSAEESKELSQDPVTSSALENYGEVIALYREVIEICAVYEDSKGAYDRYAAELGIVDEAERVLFGDLLDSAYLFYPGRGAEAPHSPHHKLSCGYAVKDLNRDGVDELVLLNEDYSIIALFSLCEGKPVLLGNYIPRGSCSINGSGTIHINGSGGADVFSRTVCQIAVGGGSLETIIEFGANGHEFTENGVYRVKYYKRIDGVESRITEAEYQALNEQYGESGILCTQQYAGLVFVRLFEKNDIAMEMYDAVIEGDLPVVDENLQKKNLADCVFPYTLTKLSESRGLQKGVLDMDGDGVNEMVISEVMGDHFVLRYYAGNVYLYAFPFRNFYHLKTDGSFSWNGSDYTSNFIHGESKLVFEDGKVKTWELWRVSNDGEPNAEYFIAGKQVTHEEMLQYLESRPQTRVEYSPLEASWIKRISLDEALEIASAHWGIRSGDIDPDTGFRFSLIPKSSGADYYRISLSWLVENTNYSTLDTIVIDALTGEIVAPEIEGK